MRPFPLHPTAPTTERIAPADGDRRRACGGSSGVAGAPGTTLRTGHAHACGRGGGSTARMAFPPGRSPEGALRRREAARQGECAHEAKGRGAARSARGSQGEPQVPLGSPSQYNEIERQGICWRASVEARPTRHSPSSFSFPAFSPSLPCYPPNGSSLFSTVSPILRRKYPSWVCNGRCLGQTSSQAKRPMQPKMPSSEPMIS